MHLTFHLACFDEVFHVGSLDLADRSKSSYEGDGLSVSVHPEDWSAIARIGGATWVLRKPEQAQFCFASYHNLNETDRDLLRAWALVRGWVEQRTVYRVSWEDEDYLDTVYTEFDTEAQARDEAESRHDEDGTDTHLSPVLVWRPTATFPEGRLSRDCDPTDVLLAVYVRETRPDLDGVWWDDDYEPDRLSAPRGVLVHDLARYARHEC